MMNSRQAYFSTGLLWLTVVLVSLGNQTSAASIDSFLKQNCYDCHNAEVNEANLNLANLKLDLENRDNFAIWNRVLERVTTAKRFVCISLALGLHNPNLVPEMAGRD